MSPEHAPLSRPSKWISRRRVTGITRGARARYKFGRSAVENRGSAATRRKQNTLPDSEEAWRWAEARRPSVACRRRKIYRGYSILELCRWDSGARSAGKATREYGMRLSRDILLSRGRQSLQRPEGIKFARDKSTTRCPTSGDGDWFRRGRWEGCRVYSVSRTAAHSS
ncbi:hypothetical protein MRX96_007033 [Rhipicephalus microplus]